jgi:hypothetical protein
MKISRKLENCTMVDAKTMAMIKNTPDKVSNNQHKVYVGNNLPALKKLTNEVLAKRFSIILGTGCVENLPV